MRPLQFLFLLLLPCIASAAQSQLKEGNRQFKKGNHERALKLYEDALIDRPYDSILHFNAGDAAYQLEDFPKAGKSFAEAAQSAHLLLKGAAHYNRGNALFRQGRWEDAVEAYKESLRANPRDEDAKYNLGVALKALKNPPQKPQQSPLRPPKAGESGDEGKKNVPSPSTLSHPKDGRGGMSREDAERLLSAAAAGEKKKSNQRVPKGEIPRPDEDW